MNPESQKLYEDSIAQMSSKDLLEELEQRALQSPIGYIDPVTSSMLKALKKELLGRIESKAAALPNESQKGAKKKPQPLF